VATLILYAYYMAEPSWAEPSGAEPSGAEPIWGRAIWVQFRSIQPKLYFPKIMKFSHYNEYGVPTLTQLFESMHYG
jgi:hypothetical protein